MKITFLLLLQFTVNTERKIHTAKSKLYISFVENTFLSYACFNKLAVHKIRKSNFTKLQRSPFYPILSHSVLFTCFWRSFYYQEITFLIQINTSSLSDKISDVSLLQLGLSISRSEVISLEVEISSQLSQPLHWTTHDDISWRIMKYKVIFRTLCEVKMCENTQGKRGNSRGVSYHFLECRSAY